MVYRDFPGKTTVYRMVYRVVYMVYREFPEKATISEISQNASRKCFDQNNEENAHRTHMGHSLLLMIYAGKIGFSGKCRTPKGWASRSKFAKSCQILHGNYRWFIGISLKNWIFLRFDLFENFAPKFIICDDMLAPANSWPGVFLSETKAMEAGGEKRP